MPNKDFRPNYNLNSSSSFRPGEETNSFRPNYNLIGQTSILNQAYENTEIDEDEFKKIEKNDFWDSVPDFYKQAYNMSIGGVIHEMMTGKKYYDLSNSPQSMKRDIAASVLSFFASWEDIALTVGSGGIGSLVAKKGIASYAGRAALGKKIVNPTNFMGPIASKAGGKVRFDHGMISNVLSKTDKQRAAGLLTSRSNLTKKQATALIDNIGVASVQGAMLGTHDGIFDAATEAKDKMLADPNFSFSKYKGLDYKEALVEVMKNQKLSSYGKGAILGVGSGLARSLGATRAGLLGDQPLAYEALSFAGAGPVLYEGRAPGPADFAAAGGLVLGLKIPGAAFSRLKRRANSKMVDELLDDDIRRSAAKKDYIERNQRNLFEQVAEPVDEAGKKFTIKGYVDTREGLSIKQMKKNQKPVDLANFEIAASARVVDGSVKKTKDGMIMKVDYQSGGIARKDRYQLDEKATEQFFNYFVDNDDILTRIANSPFSDSLKKNPLLAKEYSIARVQRFKDYAINELEDFTKLDWDNALTDTAMEFGTKKVGKNFIHPFKEAVESGKSFDIDISKLGSAERFHLEKNLYAQINIRRFLEKNSLEYNINFMYAGNPNSVSNNLKFLKPFYYHLDHPAARKAARLTNNVNLGTQQKVSDRMATFDSIVNVARGSSKQTSKEFNQYIAGVGEFTARKDRAIIVKKNKSIKDSGELLSKENNGLKSFTDDLERQAKRLFEAGDKEGAQALRNRAYYLRATSKLTDDIYFDAANVGIDVAKYEYGYGPKDMIKADVLSVLYEGMDEIENTVMKFLKRDDVGLTYGLDAVYDKEIKSTLISMVKKTLADFNSSKDPRKMKFAKLMKTLKDNDATGPNIFKDDFEMFRLIDAQRHRKTLRPFLPLVTERKVASFSPQDIGIEQILRRAKDDIFLETDEKKLIGEYILGSTRYIEMSRAFTPSGEYFEQLLKVIPEEKLLDGLHLPKFLGGQRVPSSVRTERDAVRMIKEIFTGEINFTNESKGMGKFLQSISHIEMMTKISGGFATIPNITQSIISTASELGAMRTMRNLHKVFFKKTDIDFYKRTGVAVLSSVDDMLNMSPALQTLPSRLTRNINDTPTRTIIKEMYANGQYPDIISYMAQKSADYSGFAKINEINQLVAAATAEDMIIHLTKILKGDKPGLMDIVGGKYRRRWARNKLSSLGLDEQDVLRNSEAIINRKYGTETYKVGNRVLERQTAMKTKVMRAMQKFGQKSQLQRDFLADPFLFNDPMFKPLLLFKRFGYRQFMYATDMLEREFVDGNVMPILTMGIGGFAGGQWVLWAKEEASKLLSGEPEYHTRNARVKLLKEKPMFKDFMNGISAVGALGVMGDIVTDDDPASSLSFFVKPVIIDDFQRMLRAGDTFLGSMETQWPDNWTVPFRKAGVVIAPIAGGIVSRLTERILQTPKGDYDEFMARRRETKDAVLRFILSNDNENALRAVRDFNHAFGKEYPGKVLTRKDFNQMELKNKFLSNVNKQKDEFKDYQGAK